MLKRILSIFLFAALIFAQAPTVTVPTRAALTRALTIAEADSIGTTLQHQVNASARSWGYRETGSSGLVFAYYGGPAWDGSTYTSIADGTVTLTASATNYVERTVAGVVSANTSAWTAGRLPLYLVTTTGSVVTGIVDQRTGLQALTGDVTSSGNVTALATTQPGAHTWSAAQTFNGQLNLNAQVVSSLTLSGAGTTLGNSYTTTFQNTGGSNRGFLGVSLASPSSASTASTIGFESRGELPSTAPSIPSGSFTGVVGTTRTDSGGPTGTMALAIGVAGGVDNQSSSLTVTDARAFNAQQPTATGPITTAYGVIVGNQKITNVTNGYAFYAAAQGAGGYAIYTNAGTVRFGDNVTTTGSYTGAGTGLTGTASSLTAGTATVANGLKSATTTVSVSGATAPTSGQVLTATSSTTAVWQTPSGGGAGAFGRIANGSFYQGLGPWVTSGTTTAVFNTNTATSGTSGSASMIASGGTTHITTTGSISQAFSIPAPSGAVTLTYKTACYYSAASNVSNTGSVKVYIYNASTGAETLVATNSLTATSSSPSFTNQSVTVTTNITGAGEWGVRFEIMADTNNTGGVGTKTTTTLVDDVALVI